MNEDKELEEAIVYLKKIAKEYRTYGDLDNPEFEDTKKIAKAIETVLQALEEVTKERDSIYKDYQDLGKEFYNSIPKKKIEDKIKEIENCKMDIVQSPIHNVNEKMKMLDRNMIKREVLRELLEDK